MIVGFSLEGVVITNLFPICQVGDCCRSARNMADYQWFIAEESNLFRPYPASARGGERCDEQGLGY